MAFAEASLAYAAVEGQEHADDHSFRARAIRFGDDRKPDPRRFAAVCFPLVCAGGIQSHCVVREDGIVWKKDLGHANGIDVHPAAEGLKRVE